MIFSSWKVKYKSFLCPRVLGDTAHVFAWWLNKLKCEDGSVPRRISSWHDAKKRKINKGRFHIKELHIPSPPQYLTIHLLVLAKHIHSPFNCFSLYCFFLSHQTPSHLLSYIDIRGQNNNEGHISCWYNPVLDDYIRVVTHCLHDSLTATKKQGISWHQWRQKFLC